MIMDREDIMKLAQYLIASLDEDVIDEIIRQECVKAMKYCDEKQYKYLRKTHNYFVFPEDKIKKDKKWK